MRRSRSEEPEAPAIELRPATPRHVTREPEVAPVAVAPEPDGALPAILSSLGRMQLTLDLVARQVTRVDTRLTAIEAHLGIVSGEDRGPVTSSLRSRDV